MNKSGLILALAHMVACDPFSPKNNEATKIISSSNKTDEEKAILKGLRKFIIEGVEIFALNEKSAIKKYKKRMN